MCLLIENKCLCVHGSLGPCSACGLINCLQGQKCIINAGLGTCQDQNENCANINGLLDYTGKLYHDNAVKSCRCGDV